MINVGDFISKILKTTRRENDAVVIERARMLMRQHYYNIAQRQSWQLMRQKMTLDFTDAAADGTLWLPTNLIGIDRVRDEDRYEYYPRDRHDVEPDDAGFRYAKWRGSNSPLFYGDGTIAQGASDFTCSDLTDDYTGYWVDFGTSEYFELTAIKTFTPKYWGPTQTANAKITVRPIRTEVMAIYDEDEELLIDREVTVYYWAYPPQLWKDDDEILLPDHTWLELLVFRDLPEAKERRPVNQREIDAAEAKCMMLNPAFPRERQTRDRRNRPLALDAGMFGRRR